MKSPVNQQDLQKQDIAPGLAALVSPVDGGIWLDLATYQRWLQRRVENEDEALPDTGSEPLAETSPQALFCPQCGALLQKYRLSSEHSARLDRCTPCHSVWIDAAEWAALVRTGSTHSLLQVLSDAGQRSIREAETRQRQHARYRERFGVDDFARLQATRDWLNAHPQRAELLAYLQKPAD